LNAISADGFEYSFVDEEFVVGREFGYTFVVTVRVNYLAYVERNTPK
jgi:hypothetical protein